MPRQARCQDVCCAQPPEASLRPALARSVRAAHGVVVTLGAWSGDFLAQQLSDARWAGAFRPRRGLLLEMPRPQGMPAVRHGLMEASVCVGGSSLYGMCMHWLMWPDRLKVVPGRHSIEKAPDPNLLPALAAQMGYTAHYAHSSSSSSGQPAADGGLDITFTTTTSASGTLLVGSSREFCGFGRGGEDQVVDAIMQRAAHFVPGLAAVKRQDINVRSGPRPWAAVSERVAGECWEPPGC